jgi:hypothetical protein
LKLTVPAACQNEAETTGIKRHLDDAGDEVAVIGT